MELRLTSAALDTLLQAIQQANVTDTTAGALMAVGAFGLGAIGSTSIIVNLDDTVALAGGIYRSNATTTGTKPNGAVRFLLSVSVGP